jgi:spore maturation protein CgeB
MKILLVTETWDETNGPYETWYIWILDIFRRLGHTVEAVDNKLNLLPFGMGGPTAHNYSSLMNQLRAYRANDVLINRKLRRVAKRFQPDLILFSKCENISFKTVLWLRENTHALLENWDHDNPFWYENTSINLLHSIASYDVFFALSKPVIPALYSIGCPRVEYVPMFFIPDRFKIKSDLTDADQNRFTCDILFIGNGSPKRAELLRHLVGYDLGIWGKWKHVLDPDDPLWNKIKGPQLNGEDYAKALARCKIGLNVLNVHNWGGSNLRTYEVTGCGSFLLTEYSPEQAEELFIEGEHLECFRTPEELKQKIDFYLTNEETRNAVAIAGQKQTLSHHTLEHRLNKIIETTEQIRRTKASRNSL